MIFRLLNLHIQRKVGFDVRSDSYSNFIQFFTIACILLIKLELVAYKSVVIVFKGFLWQLICELASLHGMSSTDLGVQTDPIHLPPLPSLGEYFYYFIATFVCSSLLYHINILESFSVLSVPLSPRTSDMQSRYRVFLLLSMIQYYGIFVQTIG